MVTFGKSGCFLRILLTELHKYSSSCSIEYVQEDWWFAESLVLIYFLQPHGNQEISGFVWGLTLAE